MNLASFPHLVKEWHSTKNGDLTLNDLTHGSKKKVWWKCSKGHEYEALIYNRARGTQCSYCSGRKTLNLDLWK